jgi:hypothetical protein
MPDYLTTPNDVSLQLVKADPATAPNSSQAEYNEYFEYILQIIPRMSAYFMQQTGGIPFVPYRESRSYYPQDILFPPQPIVDNSVFRLPLRAWLVALDSVTWKDEVVDTDHYRPATYRSGQDRPPYDTILFNRYVDIALGARWGGSGFNDRLRILGEWGYNENPAYAYETISTLTAGVNATTVSIPVASAALFTLYSYARVGDELMLITGRNTSTNVLTVKRGVNGFTATTHDSAAVVSVWQIQPDVQLAVTRLSALAYQRRTDIGNLVQVVQTGVTMTDSPVFVKETITKYRDINTWGAVV